MTNVVRAVISSILKRKPVSCLHRYMIAPDVVENPITVLDLDVGSGVLIQVDDIAAMCV